MVDIPPDDTDCDDEPEASLPKEDVENESFPGAPESVSRFSTWTNRTAVKGNFEIKFPWIGGNVCVKWPASGRQAMLEIAVACFAFLIVVPLALYIIFVGAVPENISRFGQMVRSARATSSDGKPEQFRPPEQVPIQTNDGIEIIEVCPACPDPDCEEDCPCPPCPICPPPTSYPIYPQSLPNGDGPDAGPGGIDPVGGMTP
jgi:hypothetical protein